VLDAVLRIILPLYGALAIAGLAAHRSRVSKQIGHDPLVIQPFSDSHQPHRHLERLLLVATVAALVDIALNALAPASVAASIGIPALQRAIPVRWLGLVMLTLGFVVCSVAIRHMGTSWRMGIDRQGPGSMVSGGLYARVRHPIYSGVLLTTAGLFLTTADAIALAVACATAVGLPVQARLEEQFLLSLYGDEYGAYLKRTGRFWPPTPRLRRPWPR
jgi:protein-S-isoprenylcysteine O-methyltransferase Ste14